MRYPRAAGRSMFSDRLLSMRLHVALVVLELPRICDVDRAALHDSVRRSALRLAGFGDNAGRFMLSQLLED